jgi:ribosomal protein S21
MSRDFNDRPKDDGTFGKKGLTVRVFNNNINGAISQLKKRCNLEGINKELRKRKHFEPNTLKRRREMAEAKSRWRKKQAQIAGLPTGKKKRPTR